MNSNQFDQQLKQIPIYQRFQSLMPFVGINYGNNGNAKVLLIAESHYLPEYSTVSKNTNDWYSSEKVELSPEEIKWMNTRGVASSKWESPGHMIFRELERNLSKHFDNIETKAFNSCAYMNGFQRPCPATGDSIKNFACPADFKVGIDTINNVINILKPELVIFTSKFAWDKLGIEVKKANKNIKMDFVCHPGTGGRYWHKKGYKHGVGKFNNLIAGSKYQALVNPS